MSKNNLSKIFLLLLVLVGATVVIKIALAQSKTNPPSSQRSEDESYEKQMNLVEALRRGGLKEAAKVKQNYVREFDPHPDWQSFDLEKLTQTSEIIIIGTPTRNICQLTPDGQLITTNYDVLVQEVLKGNIQPGSKIKVAVVGGKYTFEDGTTAEVRTPSFKKPVNGKTYVFYLKQFPVRTPIYDLTAGPQGLLELELGSLQVTSQARETDPIKNQVKNKTIEQFLIEARESAQRWSEVTPCCEKP